MSQRDLVTRDNPQIMAVSGPMLDYYADTDGPQTVTDDEIIADIRFGHYHDRNQEDPKRIVIGVPTIGEIDREIWRLPGGPIKSGWQGDIGYVIGERFMFAHLLVEEGTGTDLIEVTKRAYQRLLRFVASSPCPELLRVWNYLTRINDCERGLERYQAFCKGRSQAYAEAGIQAPQFPAATAIGTFSPGLSIHLLSSCDPGTPIENPRQISAYKYPRPYGPMPPSFCRGIYFLGPQSQLELAISGTSSIIGHVTMHPGHLGRQLFETLRNLSSLSAPHNIAPVAATAPPLLLKIYLRDQARIAEITPPLHTWSGPGARIIYLQGEICRKELEIEIEAHCVVPATDKRWPSVNVLTTHCEESEWIIPPSCRI